MKFDFTAIMDRHGKDAIALDDIGSPDGFAPAAPREGFDVIPMWIADMNFPVAPSITDAVAARVAHPAFGYYAPRDEYFDSIIEWHRKRNGIEGLEREHI